MIGVELDPNSIIAGFVAVVVAIISLFGVMIANGRSLRIVRNQVSGANGGTLGDDVYSITKKMDRLAAESDERWKVSLQTAETVSKVHSNQVNALLAAQDLMKEIAAIKERQFGTDQRMGQLENHTTRELSELRTIINLLSTRVDAMAPSPNTLTPPHGIPAVPSKQEHT